MAGAALNDLVGTGASLSILIVIWIGVAVYLWRMPQPDRTPLWRWPLLGSSTALVLSGSWLLAAVGGSDYPFGTSGVPSSLYEFLLFDGSLQPWIPVGLFSLIIGSFVAAKMAGTLWIRGESIGRYVELGAGGFMMGVGAVISVGCNLGHSLVGVPLLSLGSISTTIAIIVGVWLGNRLKPA